MVVNFLGASWNLNYIGIYKTHSLSFTHPQDLHEIELMYCWAGEPDALQAS